MCGDLGGEPFSRQYPYFPASMEASSRLELCPHLRPHHVRVDPQAELGIDPLSRIHRVGRVDVAFRYPLFARRSDFNRVAQQRGRVDLLDFRENLLLEEFDLLYRLIDDS